MAYDIDSLPGLIELGNLNELGVSTIEFDVADWLTDYPLGVFNITYIRPGETDVYPVDVTGVSAAAPESGNLLLTVTEDEGELVSAVLTWTVSDAVTAIAGSGSIVVELAEGGTIKKRSDKVQSYTADGHAAAGDPPEPLADYIEKWSDVDITVTGVAHDVAADGDITQDADGTHISLDIPAGHPGVHIGTDEPTDPDVMVWIDEDDPYDDELQDYLDAGAAAQTAAEAARDLAEGYAQQKVDFTSVGLDFTGDTGDARGTGAVDLQKSRASSDRVAASAGSFIAGGYSNKIANWINRGTDAGRGHAEGYNNTVYEWYGHAEGASCINDGKISHVEGNAVICSANDSHAEGNQNVAGRRYYYDTTGVAPIVTGSEDAGDGLGVLQYIVVPDAEGDVTSYFPNALTDDVESRYGAGYTKDIRGNIYSTAYGGTQATWDGETLLTAGMLRWAMHPFCILRGDSEAALAFAEIAKAVYSSGNGTKIYYFGDKPYSTLDGVYSSYSPVVMGGGNGQHAEGKGTSTWGDASHAEGAYTRAWNGCSHSEGYKTQAMKRSSHAEGEYTISNGTCAHAEGYYSEASTRFAHAEGYIAKASGDYGAHAEGESTIASGRSAHAEGRENTASGDYSHAQGLDCVAEGVASFAFGRDSKATRNNQNAYAVGKLSVAGDNQVSTIGYTRACVNAGWHNILLLAGIVNGIAYNFETMVIGRQTAGSEGTVGDTFAYKFTGCFIGGSGAITTLGTPTRTLIGRSAGMSGDGLTTGARVAWYGYYPTGVAGASLRFDGVADTTFQITTYTTFQEMGLPA